MKKIILILLSFLWISNVLAKENVTLAKCVDGDTAWFYLNDEKIKARFLAKEYMEEKGISSKDEIESLVKKYDELNDIGIKFINFKFFEGIIIKAVILSFIFMIF